MTRLFFIWFLTSVSAACGSGSMQQANHSDPIVSLSMEQRALKHLKTLPGYLRFKQSGLSLRVVSDETDSLGMTHLRFHQYFQDVPLQYGELIAHIKEGRVYRIDGELAELGLVSANPSINAEQAIHAAVQYKQLSPPFKKHAQLQVIALKQVYDQLAWEVTINKGLQRYILLIDANSGSVIKEIPGIHTTSTI